MLSVMSLRRFLSGVLIASTLALGPFALAQTVSAGFGSMRLSGVAGGSVRATRFGNTADGFCTGWIGSSPNHTLTLERDFERLTVSVEAPSDTTLVVLGPTGTRCNDDDGSSPNPRISGRFAAGEYRVYVGSYAEGQSIRYTLSIRE